MATTVSYSKIDKSLEEVKTVVEDINGEKLTVGEKIQCYSDWAQTYENDLTLAGYVAPQTVAEAVSGILGSNHDAIILDFLCGTGLVGAELFKRGYRNLYGLDGSKGMLELAKSKGIYKMLQEEIVGEDPLKSPNATYDVIVSTGSFIAGHVNQKCFDELIRIIKPGGYLVLFISWLHKETEEMKDIDMAIIGRSDRGQWNIISHEIREFRSPYQGDLYVLKCLHPK